MQKREAYEAPRVIRQGSLRELTKEINVIGDGDLQFSVLSAGVRP